MNTQSISMKVAEQVKQLGSEKVVNQVVDTLVTSEINKRAEALAGALKMMDESSRELKKTKPDQVAIQQDGKKVETYSAKAFEARQKLEEKIAKIDKIVEAAVDNGEWGKLYDLVKNAGN